MSEQLVIDLAVSAVCGLIAALSFWLSFRNQKKRSAGQYLPLICFSAIPAYVLGRGLYFLFLNASALPTLLLRAFLFLLISDLLLLALMPLLRKRLSAAACASLWLLPVFVLFLRIVLDTIPLSSEILAAIRIPRLSVVFLLIWGAGFAVVLGWQIASHLSFRRRLLRRAVPVADEEAALFSRVKRLLCNQKDKFDPCVPVLRSPDAASPLTIGLWKPCVILPDRTYDTAELLMIYRHEWIHLLRRDNLTKLFFSLVRSAGWFLPPLWLGLGKASEDLELCCDELAVANYTEEQKREYAEMLLSNTGSSQGFTTCLSASASGLRYRMGRMLHPKKRTSGMLAAGLLTVLFVFSIGTVAFAVEAGTVETVIYPETAGYEITDLRLPGESFFRSCSDPAALEAYLSGVRLYELEGDNVSSAVLSPICTLYFRNETKGTRGTLTLRESSLSFSYRYGYGQTIDETRVFVLDEPLDVEYVQSLIGEPITPQE